MENRGVSDGERKIITILFADIKGSMSLIEELDPEEAQAFVDPALQRMLGLAWEGLSVFAPDRFTPELFPDYTPGR